MAVKPNNLTGETRDENAKRNNAEWRALQNDDSKELLGRHVKDIADGEEINFDELEQDFGWDLEKMKKPEPKKALLEEILLPQRMTEKIKTKGHKKTDCFEDTVYVNVPNPRFIPVIQVPGGDGKIYSTIRIFRYDQGLRRYIFKIPHEIWSDKCLEIAVLYGENTYELVNSITDTERIDKGLSAFEISIPTDKNISDEIKKAKLLREKQPTR